jgi:type VI secretion system protein ImpH
MEAAMRKPADHLTHAQPAAPQPAAVHDLFTSLAAEPYRHDFYMALRHIECAFPALPRLGTAPRPAGEPLRLGQEPALDFAPAALSSLEPGRNGRPPRLGVRFFGLFGPQGPLPLHLTDYARERLLHHGDTTFARFADMFHHRLLLLFYRAWAQAQPTVSLDRPASDRFADYVGALFGTGTPAHRGRDAVDDHAKLFFAGRQVRQVRNADGLAAVLTGYFKVPVRVESFVGHWMELPKSERTRLPSRADRLQGITAQLGVGAVAGHKVWDRQHKFRIHVGPLGLAQYQGFLPTGSAVTALADWVRHYIGRELEWDLRLVLKRPEVPATTLGGRGRLGWGTWLGRRRESGDADSLTLYPERDRARSRPWTAPPRRLQPQAAELASTG